MEQGDITNLVSIILPVFNSESTITDAINSICFQTYQNIEIIIIDDCSSDKTFEICRAYSEKDQRIKIIRNQKNLGVTKSLIKGIQISKGEYIARQDGDDVSWRGRIATQKILADYFPCSLICCSSKNLTSGVHRIYNISFLEIYAEKITPALVRSYNFIHGSFFLKKDFYYSIGGYRPVFRYSQDYDVLLRMPPGSRLINVITPELYTYRVNKNSIVNRVDLHFRRAIKKVIEIQWSVSTIKDERLINLLLFFLISRRSTLKSMIFFIYLSNKVKYLTLNIGKKFNLKLFNLIF